MNFFPEWYDIEPQLKAHIRDFRTLSRVSRDFGLNLYDILNLYTGRIAAFTIFQVCVDSYRKPDSRLMLSAEILDIFLFHVIDDIIDRTPNPLVRMVGDSRAIALSLAALFDVFRLYPLLTRVGEFYEHDFSKPSTLNGYIYQLYARAAKPVEILLELVEAPGSFIEFWKNSFMYLKVLDDIVDGDTSIPLEKLIGIREKLLRECRRLALTGRQRKFLKVVLDTGDSILEASTRGTRFN